MLAVKAVHVLGTWKRAQLLSAKCMGSPEYASFLEEVTATLLGVTLTFPEFIPGDIKNSSTSKGRKKKKQNKRRSQQNEPTMGRQNGAPKLEKRQTAGAAESGPTKEKTLKEHFRALRCF